MGKKSEMVDLTSGKTGETDQGKVSAPPWDLDEGLRLIGARGRWQIGIYISICVMYITLSFHWQAFVFQVDTPTHHCKIPVNATKNETIPGEKVNGEWKYDSCLMYKDFSVSNETMPCNNGWEYDPNSGYIRTVVTDFDLVCGDNILVEVSMMVSNGAMALGQVFANKLADAYGRKTIFLIGCLSRGLLGIAKAFAPNMITYIILDALCFIAMTCFASMLLLLVMELFPAEFRSFAQTTMEFAWFTSMMLCTIIVFIFRDWRVMQLVMHVPILLGLAYYWLVPESLPWLMVKKRYDRVKHYIEMGGRINKKPIDPEFFEGKISGTKSKNEADDTFGSVGSIGGTAATNRWSSSYGSGPIWVKMMRSQDNLNKGEDKEDDSGIGSEVIEESSVMDVWRSTKMRFYTLTLFLLWFTNSIIYSALSLTVTYLSGDRYLNFFLLAMAELPAIVAFHLALNRYGRRYPICVFHVITGLSLLLTLLEVFGVAPSAFAITMNFIGKFGITASYCSILVFSPELYPTNIRSVYYGMCFFWALSAALIAPYCRPIEREVPGIVRAVCGVLSLIVAVLVLFMPETFRRALPKSVKEVERWPRNVTPEEIEKFNILRANENKPLTKDA